MVVIIVGVMNYGGALRVSPQNDNIDISVSAPAAPVR